MKRSMSMLLALMLLMSSLVAMPAYAETVLRDGIEVTLTTDKESYEALDAIDAKLTVKNTNSFDVENVSMEIQAPQGYLLTSDGETKIGELSAGETQQQQTVMRDTEAPMPALPQTGDNSHGMMWGLLFVLSSAAVCALVIRRPQAKRIISLLLCVALVAPYMLEVAPALAQEELATEMIMVSKEVLVNGETVVLTGMVTYQAAEAAAETAENTSAFGLKINEVADSVKVREGDTLSFTGMISATEGATISAVQVFVYDATTEEPYTMGEKYYATDGLNVAQFDLASVPEMTVGEAFGESDYALTEGGRYAVMFYATDSNGNSFADTDLSVSGNQGPVINVRVLTSPENCDHSAKEYTYERDDSVASRATDSGDGLTHLVEESYERYCADCGAYLMNIWGEGASEDHTMANGMCTGCGYAPVILMQEIPSIEFVSPGASGDYYLVFTSDEVNVKWKDTGLSTEYVVNVKILDGEPNENLETESGMLMSEYCDSNYTRTEMTIRIPESAKDKWIKINVHGKISETEQTEAGSSLYLEVRNEEEFYEPDAPCGHENARTNLFEKKYILKDSKEHIQQKAYSIWCDECTYGTEKILFVEQTEQHNFLTEGSACTNCGYVQGNTCKHNYTVQTKSVNYTRQYMYDGSGNAIPSTKHAVSENIRTECNACGALLDNARSHYDEQHEYNNKNVCVKCGYRPDNDTCMHHNRTGSEITGRYEPCADDNSMHNLIYERTTETCADCGTTLAIIYVSIQKLKHSMNKDGVCWDCGYTEDENVCQHTEYTDTYYDDAYMYFQKNEYLHYYVLCFTRTCNNCGQMWLVINNTSDEAVAPHTFENGVCTKCEYVGETIECQHTPGEVKTYNRHIFAPFDAEQHQTTAIIWDVVCSTCGISYEMTDTEGDENNPVSLKYDHVWDETGKCETQGCEYQCVHTFEDIMRPDGNHKAENGIWESKGESGHWCTSIEWWEKCVNCGLEQKYTKIDPYKGEPQDHMMNHTIKTYYGYDDNEHWPIGADKRCTANGCGYQGYVEVTNVEREKHDLKLINTELHYISIGAAHEVIEFNCYNCSCGFECELLGDSLGYSGHSDDDRNQRCDECGETMDSGNAYDEYYSNTQNDKAETERINAREQYNIDHAEISDEFLEGLEIKIDNIAYQRNEMYWYGGIQHSPMFNVEDLFYELLRERMELDYAYTERSYEKAYEYLVGLNQRGCEYTALASTIFEQFKNDEKGFYATFGYSMYIDGHLNYDAVIVDFYLYANEWVVPGGHGYRERKWVEFCKEHGIKCTIPESETVILGTGFDTSGIEHTLSYYAECMNNGTVPIVGMWGGFDLLDENGKKVYNEGDAHAMVVTGVYQKDQDYYLVVSSWGHPYLIEWKQVVNKAQAVFSVSYD